MGFGANARRKEGDTVENVTRTSEMRPVVRCKNCCYWDRDTIRQNSNDFGWWNEAECKKIAERDGWNEIDRYTSADFFCAYGERED